MNTRVTNILKATGNILKKANDIFGMVCIFCFCCMIDGIVLGGIFAAIWFAFIADMQCNF